MAAYEVFISFRNSDDLGRPTRDKDMAEALYRALSAKGISTFYSNRSINEAGAADYVDAIDEALDCCNILVAVGTSRENLESFWVKDEIKRFRTDMLNGVKERGKSAMISYRSPEFSPKALPNGLRHNQSYTDLNEVVKFIETFRKKGSSFRDFGETEVLYDSYADRAVPAPSQPGRKEENCMQPGTIIDGRYNILNLVGRGGMSYVHFAFDEKLKRSVAVKEYRKDGALSFDVVADGLISEISLMKKLNHPAIPKVHDVINAGDSIIFVMDFIEGMSLNQMLTQQKVLDEEKTVAIGRQLADALNYLHSLPSPVIYRDMKPANIIMKPDGDVMLIDFGTAREYKKNATEDTTCLGTVGYAAPEQFGGMGQTDARTDIYCLGATLYHLVTGCNPGEPPYEIRPIRQIDPELSSGLAYIIETCTQRDPEKRFQSAAELLDAFENIKKLGSQAQRRAALREMGTKIAESIPLTDKWLKKKYAAQKKTAPKPAQFAIPGDPSFQNRQLQQPQRVEGLMDTTILSPAPPVPAPPVSRPIPVPPPHMPPPPVRPFEETGVLRHPTAVPASEETEILNRPAPPLYVPREEIPAPSPAAPVKPKTRKVTVRSKAAADPELEEMVAKLSALDPESKKLVRQLIDQLSK